MLAHVPKTGGSTVSEVLQALPGGWLFLGRPQSGHPKFFAMYGSTFHRTPGFTWSGLGDCARFRNSSALDGGASSIEGSRCGGVPDWRNSRIIVDFHEPRGLLKFHHAFMPRLRELRAKYAAAGCAMQVGTVLREPSSQMLSEFLYFHVQFNKGLHRNASRQESSLLSYWLPGRANPQLAWLRGRACRMHGLIFLCTTPPHEPCGDDLNGLSLDAAGQQAEAERKVTDPIVRMLSEFDVVGTSKRVGEVIWAMAARVGFVLDSSSPSSHKSGGSSGSGSSGSSSGSSSGGGGGGGGGSGSDGNGGGDGNGGNSSAAVRAPSFAAPKCNPPARTGAISLTSLSPATLSVLERHSRCDRVLYEAALLRENADLAFAAHLEHHLLRRRAANRRLLMGNSGSNENGGQHRPQRRHEPQGRRLDARAAEPSPLQPPDPRLAQVSSTSGTASHNATPQPRAESSSEAAGPRWQHSFAGELYVSGSAYHAAAEAKLVTSTGLLNLDPTLLEVRSHEEMAQRLVRNFSVGFLCKVA